MKHEREADRDMQKASVKPAGQAIGERGRFLLLALIMVGACAMVMAVMTVILYQQEIEARREMLQVTVKSQTHLIEAVASYNARVGDIMRDIEPDYDASAATLSQIIDSHDRYEGFGKTGEFMLARRDGDAIVFVMRHRHEVVTPPGPVAFDSAFAEPMRRALDGLSGTVISLDYRGETVLAAYEPVDVLNLGIVAKMDLAEIRAPFIRAVLFAAAVALLVILVGTILFTRVSNPLIARLEQTRKLEQEIKDRKQAQAAMRESEERYRVIAEDMPVLICRSLPGGEITFVNKAYCDYFAKKPEELVGSNLLSLTPEADRDTVKANIAALTVESPTQSHEHSVIGPEGEIRWQRWTNRALFDADGNVVAYQDVGEDITERKRAEEALRDSELRNRTLLEDSPVCTKIIDLDSKLQYMSAAGKELLKVPDIEPYYGCTYPPEVYPEAARISLIEAVEKAKAGEISDVECSVFDMEGGVVWFHSTFVPARDSEGHIAYIIGTSVDVTERKQAEEALKQKEYYLSRAQEIGMLGTWELDIANNVLIWTDENYRIFGVPLGTPLTFEVFLKCIHPDDREYVQQEWSKGINHEPYDIEHRLLVDGKVKWVREKAEFTNDENGDPIKAIGFTQDITERKQAETEREDLIAQLEAQNAELERFTYTVSHDLKSPLVTINGYVGMLRQDLADGDSETVRTDLDRISDAADKMEQLLRDVLELSRIGRLVNFPEDVSLEELAREAIELVGGQIGDRGVRVDVSSDLPMVFGDRLRLREVLQNLVDNAVKYMGDQPEPRIEIGLRSDGNDNVYYVRDNGIGIDADYHKKVFGLFDQLSPKVEGSGIGLALVKRIVEVHGGRIWVESEGPGLGSTFCFTLAAKSEAAQRPDTEPSMAGR